MIWQSSNFLLPFVKTSEQLCTTGSHSTPLRLLMAIGHSALSVIERAHGYNQIEQTES